MMLRDLDVGDVYSFAFSQSHGCREGKCTYRVKRWNPMQVVVTPQTRCPNHLRLIGTPWDDFAVPHTSFDAKVKLNDPLASALSRRFG